MSESMKIRNLKNYGIPSHIVNIWEKEEEAVRNYGILNCGEDKEGRMQYAPTGRIDSRLRGCVTITSFAYNKRIKIH